MTRQSWLSSRLYLFSCQEEDNKFTYYKYSCSFPSPEEGEETEKSEEVSDASEKRKT